MIYKTYFDDPPRFPRIDTGWARVAALLADGKWHSHAELVTAFRGDGELSDSTATQVLASARKREVTAWENRPVKGTRYRFYYRKAS